MAPLRLLNDGTWSKPPVLTAARRLLIDGLSKYVRARPLGELASFLNGTSYDQQSLSNEGTPIIRISNMSNPRSEYISTLEPFDSKYRIVHGDLLVSWSASFRSIIWPGPDGILNQHIFKVTEFPGNHRGFIRHAIEAVFDDIQQKVVGIGMMHLRRDDFLGYLVPAPEYETQKRISAFLDWVESGREGDEPTLPQELQEQRSLVAKIELLSANIEEARVLRQQAEAEANAFILSVHKTLAGLRTRRIGDLLKLDEHSVPILPAGTYPQVGVRSFGGGLFRKTAVEGTKTTYRAFNQLYEGAVLLSQVKGWEGAVAVCPAELAGWFVSPEYRTFRCIPTEARPGYLASLVRTEWFWSKLANATRGVGARRERTRPEQFLEITMAMPSVEAQEGGEAIFAKVNSLKGVQAATAIEFDALMPSILSEAFSGEL